MADPSAEVRTVVSYKTAEQAGGANIRIGGNGMRDVVFVYWLGEKIMQATLNHWQAERFEMGLGDRLIGKVVLEAR